MHDTGRSAENIERDGEESEKQNFYNILSRQTSKRFILLVLEIICHYYGKNILCVLTIRSQPYSYIIGNVLRSISLMDLADITNPPRKQPRRPH